MITLRILTGISAIILMALILMAEGSLREFLIGIAVPNALLHLTLITYEIAKK